MKVLTLLPAVNDTFAMLAIPNVGKSVFVHLDVKATILFELQFKNAVD